MLSFTDFALPKTSGFSQEPVAPMIVAGTDGTVWATDPVRARVVRLTDSGASKQYRLPRGAQPVSIALSKNKSLWFVDAATGRIGHVAAGGTGELKLPKSGGRSYTPLALTVGPDGNVWCTANYTDPQGVDFPIVARITAGGKVREFALPTGGYTHSNLPDTITSWTDGNLYTMDDDRLLRVKATGESEIVQGNYPSVHQHLITLLNGDLGAPGYDISLAGGSAVFNFKRVITGPGMNGWVMPKEAESAAAAGSDGNVWFVNAGHNGLGLANSIGFIDSAGNMTSVEAPGGDRIASLTRGSDGNLWIVNADASHIYRLDLTDALLGATVVGGQDGTGSEEVNETADTQAPIAVATVIDLSPGAGAGDLSAKLSWPDGVNSDGTIMDGGNGSFIILGDRTVPLGSSQVTATITDQRTGQTVTVTSSYNGQLLQPSATPIAVTATAGVTFSGSIGDVTVVDLKLLSQYSATIDWGDGTSSPGTLVADGSGGAFLTGSHQYAQAGSYAIRATGSTPNFMNRGQETGAGYVVNTTAQVSA